MALSVQLTPEEEALLEEVSRRTERDQGELVRQAIREFCQVLVSAEKSPYELGEGLFEAGALAAPSADPGKLAIWEKLRAKHEVCHPIDWKT